MSLIESLKAEAVALRLSEKALGRTVKHSEALERVAKKHGYENWRACCATLMSRTPGEAGSPLEKNGGATVTLRPYISEEWNFALDIPDRWNRFPPVSGNSPFEVARFLSYERGNHGLTVFRWPCDPKQPLSLYAGKTQELLKNKGYGNFALSETDIGRKPALVMEFDKTQDFGFYSCHHYFVTAGTLGYTLGFGSSSKAQMFELYERMAKTFEVLPHSLT
jgi:Glyoxalase superfamily protein